MAKDPTKGSKASAPSTSVKAGDTPAANETPQSAATSMPPPTVASASAGPNPASKPDTAPAKDVAPAQTATASSVPNVKTPKPAPTAPVVQRQRSGFFTLVLGGLFAGLIGYGASYLQFGEMGNGDAVIAGDVAADDSRLVDLSEQVAALEAQLAALPVAAPDNTTDTADSLGSLQATVDSLQAKVDEDIAGLQSQIDALPAQPLVDSDAQEAAVASLSAQIADQQSKLQEMTAAAEAQIAETRAEAEAIKLGAVDTARNATARAALARVQGALESGAAMTPALSDLSDSLADPVPDALTAVADGAPTLASLQDSFGDYARAANSDARAAGEDGENAGRLTSFLRSQLDVRSTGPRDGTSVDAILSRAEAALRDGRLNDALAEIATLPETARTAMSDWTAQAESRAAALDAADTLATSLNAN